MNERILCVDDDPNLLAALRRQLRTVFQMDTVVGAQEALAAIEESGPYAVVVSDMRMPGMDGAQLLARVHEIAPTTVRIMLTGCGDMQTAIDAVNQGAIFRFLTKPCSRDTFAQAVGAGLEQHRLLRAEKDLLEKTLQGSVRVLSEILSLVNPEAFSRSARVCRTASAIARRMKIGSTWELEIAAMLSQVGCVAVPAPTLQKVFRGEEMSEEEQMVFLQHPSIGGDLIGKIPRLERVASIIAHQACPADGTAACDETPPEALILRAALDYDTRLLRGESSWDALESLRGRRAAYTRHVLEALTKVVAEETGYEFRTVKIAELRPPMILAEDVVASDGLLLIAKGQEVTETLRERLHNYDRLGHIAPSINVQIPCAAPATAGAA